jgi:hypothetical protein
MRIIPVVDISSINEIKIHNFEWENGIVDFSNIQRYKQKISEFCGNDISQHIEISSRSDYSFAKSLRTASLYFMKGDQKFYSESIYQGSKVLEVIGDQHRLYDIDGENSLRAKSRFKSKKVISINLFGYIFDTFLLSDLHDLVYWIGLEHTHQDIDKKLQILDKHKIYFLTDCFDGENKNSQSKSFAKFFWRWRRGESVWDFLSENQKNMKSIIEDNSYKKTTLMTAGMVQMEALFD